MKTRFTHLLLLLGCIGLGMAPAVAEPAPPSGDPAAAIQAIEQAPDPSAVVAAFANGVAAAGSQPRLYQAYVARMIDLGLPEMAFHQARTLTTLESDNGLAWAVIAYVNARRGEMQEALAAINLAGQFVPDNAFIQRTAGEITAWYELKADKAQLPTNLREGMEKLRPTMEGKPAFTEAYNTAKSAYQSQSNASQLPPAVSSPGQAVTNVPAPAVASPPTSQVVPYDDQYVVPPSAYYPASPTYYYQYPSYSAGYYYYDWGPNWIQPSPWWWWRPVGFFAGTRFYPYSTVILFDHHRSFRHSHHRRHHHHRPFPHGHAHFNPLDRHRHGVEADFRHRDGLILRRDGQVHFYGRETLPNPTLAARPGQTFRPLPAAAPARPDLRSSGRPLFANPDRDRVSDPVLALPPPSTTQRSESMRSRRGIAAPPARPNLAGRLAAESPTVITPQGNPVVTPTQPFPSGAGQSISPSGAPVLEIPRDRPDLAPPPRPSLRRSLPDNPRGRISTQIPQRNPVESAPRPTIALPAAPRGPAVVPQQTPPALAPLRGVPDRSAPRFGPRSTPPAVRSMPAPAIGNMPPAVRSMPGPAIRSMPPAVRSLPSSPGFRSAPARPNLSSPSFGSPRMAPPPMRGPGGGFDRPSRAGERGRR